VETIAPAPRCRDVTDAIDWFKRGPRNF